MESELDVGYANITTRVPSLRFKRANQIPLSIHDLSDYIKLVMAPSNRDFIESDYNTSLSSVFDSSIYSPQVSPYLMFPSSI